MKVCAFFWGAKIGGGTKQHTPEIFTEGTEHHAGGRAANKLCRPTAQSTRTKTVDRIAAQYGHPYVSQNYHGLRIDERYPNHPPYREKQTFSLDIFSQWCYAT